MRLGGLLEDRQCQVMSAQSEADIPMRLGGLLEDRQCQAASSEEY